MKKNILTILLGVVLCTSAYAQLTRYDVEMSEKLVPTVSRKAGNAKKAESKKQSINWLALVKEELQHIKRPSYVGDNMYGWKTPVYEQVSVSAKDAGLFTQHRETIQKAISFQETVKEFKFVVPQPKDLVKLDEMEVARLVFLFLESDNAGVVTSAKKKQDGVVEVIFRPKGFDHKLLLVFSCREQRIYFFLKEH